jgi:hypothetical protein
VHGFGGIQALDQTTLQSAGATAVDPGPGRSTTGWRV